jgi:hypothetical protein
LAGVVTTAPAMILFTYKSKEITLAAMDVNGKSIKRQRSQHANEKAKKLKRSRAFGGQL